MRKAVRHWLTRATGATAAALLVAGNTASATYAAGQHRQDIHITAHFAATIVVDPAALTCGGFDVTSMGSATGVPIGAKGTWKNMETACTLALPGRYDIHGTAIVGASDGDQIDIGYHVTAPVTGGVIVYPSGTFSITGGTGEYAHATGGGTMRVVVNLLNTSHVSATLTGSIS